MSNDGTSYKPWKVRKGVFKSTGTSDYALPPRDTPSPIIEMPMSPAPAPRTPCSPLSPSSPRVMIIESPLSPSMIQRNISNVREIPIERFDEVRRVNGNSKRRIFLDRLSGLFIYARRKTKLARSRTYESTRRLKIRDNC